MILYKEDELKNSILMIFANKQDMENPLTPAEISKTLGLCSLKNRTWSIFKTSAINGEGLEEAMNWLETYVILLCIELVVWLSSSLT